jgi:hypothetical protein
MKLIITDQSKSRIYSTALLDLCYNHNRLIIKVGDQNLHNIGGFPLISLQDFLVEL